MAKNTRVKDLMEKIEAELDPDQLGILKFDLAQAMGRKDAGVKKPPVRKRSGGGSEMTDKQKKEVRISVYVFLGGYVVFLVILLILNSYN